VVRDTVVIIREIVPVQLPEPEPVPEPPKEEILYLIGTVRDSETGEPVLAKIDVIDLTTDLVVGTTASSDADGTYRIKLPEKRSYMIDLRASGFLSDMKRINVPADYAEEVYKLDVPLIKVKVGKKVVLNNILFETGKSILTVSSYTELDRLLSILEDSPNMKIEISGHTDNTGSLDLNNRLSQSRAQSVVEYLVQKGIDRARLEFKGYGPSQPIADNATAEGRKANRRVEFKILEF
jgi:outer membrane protein OmpA-like peptidoglycan-associated protein